MMTNNLGILIVRFLMSVLYLIDGLTFFNVVTKISLNKRFIYVTVTAILLFLGVYFGFGFTDRFAKFGKNSENVLSSDSYVPAYEGGLANEDGYVEPGYFLEEIEPAEGALDGDFTEGDNLINNDKPNEAVSGDNLKESADQAFTNEDELNSNISAKSVLAVDFDTGQILFEKNKDLILPPASTSKLMTSIIALEKYNPDDVLEVTYECASLDTTKAWLPAGSRYTVNDLLHATLIFSAGDAACTLASGVMVKDGKSLYDPSFSNQFIYDMNQKAKSLELKQTFYTNAVGLDGVATSHYSTTQDLYKLTKEALKSDLIRDIVKTREYEIESVDKQFSYKGQNTNKLLWEIEGTVGVKTGTTLAAGEVLVYQYNKDGNNIIIIVMGSANRFEDTKKILSYVLQK